MNDPENSDALRALASDYLALGQADEALRRVRAAVASHPSSARLLDLEARVLLKMGRNAEAVRAIDAALAAEPGFAPALEAKGSLARTSGDLDGALVLFTRAAEADTSSGDYPYRAAQVHLMKNDNARASELLSQALAADPGHVAANNDLAWILASSGQDLERALELAQRAVRMERSADTLDTLGYVHLRSGDAEQAVTTLGKALEARPDSPSIEYRLGVALAAKGDKEEARAILTKALSAPAFPEAEAARAELAKLQGS